MSISGVMRNNAAFSMMQGNNSMMGLARNAGSFKNQSGVANSEKTLQMDKLNNELVFNASSLMEDSEKKVKDDNIKRSFNAFA